MILRSMKGKIMEERSDRDKTGFEAPDERIRSDVGESAKTVHVEERGTGNPGLGRRLTGLMIGTSFLSAVVGGLIVAYALPYMYGSTPKAVFSSGQNQSTGTSNEIVKVNGAVSPATAVAKKLGPSVVNVSVNQGPQDAVHSGLTSGVGSGVIYTQDGYIITNNHVVSGARAISVTIGNDEVKAKLVAADPETDLAIIKVDKTGLPAAEFGSTKNLQVGEPAVAIGSPFGFEHTVTSGIISALNRNVTIPDEQGGDSVSYSNLIQTDAPINPGNSGGALSDATGKVIGISALIISSSGVNDGVGFAIPVDMAKRVADQLIKQGKASHPYIGILGRDVSEVANDNETAIDEGALVAEVVPGGPAAKAGLKKDDIIIAIGGTPIDDMGTLIAEIRQKEVGDRLEVTYVRNGKEGKTTLTLTEKPKQ
ncbi:S1C family serine protease [Candidatus Aquicultor sp.]